MNYLHSSIKIFWIKLIALSFMQKFDCRLQGTQTVRRGMRTAQILKVQFQNSLLNSASIVLWLYHGSYLGVHIIDQYSDLKQKLPLVFGQTEVVLNVYKIPWNSIWSRYVTLELDILLKLTNKHAKKHLHPRDTVF